MNTNPISTDGIKEPVSHGTAEFPLQLYKDVIYRKAGLVFYNHWHEEAEILFVTEGELELVINDISIYAKRGTVVLIPPNLLHAAYQSTARKGSFSSIVFHPDFITSKNNDKIQKEQLTPFLDNTFVSSYIMNPTDQNSDLVQSLLQKFSELYVEQAPCKELMMKGYLYLLLFYLLQNEKKYNLKSSSAYLNEERKKHILTYIEENYQNPLTLQEMAASVNLSKEQFCRFFKQAFRSTPVSYLNQYRINRSMDLLTKSDLPVIDIAVSVGFDSSNYFSIAFRKSTGMTPSQYRKMTRY